MIVTKQRRSIQSATNPYNRQQKYNYRRQNEQPLSRDYGYVNNLETVPINYGNRQRHSISTVSPISKHNRQNIFYSNTKKTQKKYDYSINLQNSIDKQNYMNKTHDNLKDKHLNRMNQLGQSSNKLNFVMNENDRKRINSVNNKSISKQYLYTQSKPKYDQKPFNAQSYIVTRKNQQSKDDKIDIKSYLKSHEPRQQQINNRSYEKRRQQIGNKQNEMNINRIIMNNSYDKQIMNNNYLLDNFGVTDKLKQFSAENRLFQGQQNKNKTKYEPKYAKMRINKRYQLISSNNKQLDNNNYTAGKYIKQKQKQKINQNKLVHNNNKLVDNKSIDTKLIDNKQINIQKLLQHSHLQNSKVIDKINRISQLNLQINQRLQNMLNKNKYHS